MFTNNPLEGLINSYVLEEHINRYLINCDTRKKAKEKNIIHFIVINNDNVNQIIIIKSFTIVPEQMWLFTSENI